MLFYDHNFRKERAGEGCFTGEMVVVKIGVI